MLKHNLFFGENYHSSFASLIYKRLISREWFTYADIMADYLGPKSDKSLANGISNCEGYGELRKTFLDIRKAIKERLGVECIEVTGNIRNKHYRYIGSDDDPLADMRNAKVINNLRLYWKFCQDSAGFFPQSWLDYYFQDCVDLLNIKEKKKKGEQVISSDVDRHQTNIEYLPILYESIKNHQVLSIDYKPYEEDTTTLTFHPHFLKEYNGRWHLLGFAEEQEKEGIDLALDRIANKPREVYNKEFICAPERYYESFFKNLVGVSHHEGSSPEIIHIRAHTLYIHRLMETKRLHETQETVLPFEDHEDGSYGEFTVNVEVNNEFIGRILQMGDGLEIISPKEVRNIFRERVANIAKLYE